MPCTEQTKTQSGFLPSIQKNFKSRRRQRRNPVVCVSPLICFWFSLQKLCVRNSFCFACMRHSFVFVCMRVFCDWEKESSGVLSKKQWWWRFSSRPVMFKPPLSLLSLSLNSDDGMWWTLNALCEFYEDVKRYLTNLLLLSDYRSPLIEANKKVSPIIFPLNYSSIHTHTIPPIPSELFQYVLRM